MNNTVHEILPVSDGTHILIYKFDGVEYVFERKVFVSASEYRA